MHFFENGIDFQQDSILTSKYYVLADTYRAYLDRMERVDYLYGHGWMFDSLPEQERYHDFCFDMERMENPQHPTPEQAVQTLLERGASLGFAEEELYELAQQVTVEPDATGGLDSEYLPSTTDAESKKIFENFRSE